MKVFKWSADCKVINGFTRSAIYDLARQDVLFVDKDVSQLISKINGINVGQLKLNETEKQWFDLFIEKEFIYEIPEVTFKSFIDISEDWDIPQKISNAVISSRNNFSAVNEALEKVNCKHILVTFDNDAHLDRILNLYFTRTDYFSVDLLIRKTTKNFGEFLALKEKYRCLNIILIEDENFIKEDDNYTYLRKVKAEVAEEMHIPSLHFTNDTFYESNSHNLYFNRKLFIGHGGLISLYGSGSFQTSLSNIEAIIENEEERLRWFATKDETAICSDCELRRMCIDQRIPKKTSDGWYYGTECSYNPYLAKWSGEEGYHDLESSGVIIKGGQLSINNKTLEHVFKEVWNEEV